MAAHGNSMIPVKFLNFNQDAPDGSSPDHYWDMHQLHTIFRHPPFAIVEDDPLSGVIVIPARQNKDYYAEINQYIATMDKVLLILSGDEESSFPVEKIKHPLIKIWSMTPQIGREYPNVDRFYGSGLTPHSELLPHELPDKNINFFFSGQVNNDRRIQAVKKLSKINGKLVKTPGFGQGLGKEEYINNMAAAKVVPCPGGTCTPDTFRVYEALEAMAIPIVDVFSSRNKQPGYWNLIFGDNLPFPLTDHWTDADNLVQYYSDTYNQHINKIFAWWLIYKRNLRLNLINDYRSLSSPAILEKGITVIVPTSPIHSHPDTSMIEETIRSIRHHLPDAEIIITFDGVREQQLHYTDRYNEYIRKMLWKINREMVNVVPLVFEQPMHQVAMAREALKLVQTDKILYVEHDTPLIMDNFIEWNGCEAMIDTGIANVVRFHFEAKIPEPHDYMMLDKSPRVVCGIKAIRTSQWSQRPHLASTEFYKKILAEYFSPEARTFIEDKMYGVVVEEYKRFQLQGWNKFKVWIYAPDGDYHGYKRSYNLDGRGHDPKFEMQF